jgi:S-methylmethionine-dependent homocysteine/selenocysteine methylase/SAM-dependent methyltransferase
MANSEVALGGDPASAVEVGYARLEQMIATGRCLVLDGAVGTELLEIGGAPPERDEAYWGVGAILEAPERVAAVHRSYVEVGCDVLSTNTWGLPSALRRGGSSLWGAGGALHWMDLARRGVSLARGAAADAGRPEEVAVAFSLNADIDAPDGAETIGLLARAFESEQPDLLLVETLALLRESTYATVERLLEAGLPVWLSFRRCRHGLCGVYGEHWGGPEGDAFGRAARRFEEMGVSALLVNCVPPDHIAGMVSWLRDFTDLPLGVYPNLGYLSETGWRYEHEIGGAQFAELARGWREEGAQIIGGCCGVAPEHIAAARAVLLDSEAGRQRRSPLHASPAAGARRGEASRHWSDPDGRRLFPLDFPDIVVDAGVFSPTHGSFLVWKHLYLEGIGKGLRCLDIGCGTGLQAVQLARNGAEHVHAIDLEQAAVVNTLTNAFRNGVADRVSAARADLYPWVPAERYGAIVASLYQMPNDPYEETLSHRPLDFWGRNLVDHLIGLLPSALAPGGVAYLMQLSILGAERTSELLERAGLSARVVDFSFLELRPPFEERAAQIARVEAHSDAYHLGLGREGAIVAYLLEIRPTTGARAAAQLRSAGISGSSMKDGRAAP